MRSQPFITGGPGGRQRRAPHVPHVELSQCHHTGVAQRGERIIRIARQALLTRTTYPPVFNVVLNEAILHRPVGGAEAARGQLKHLLEVSELPTVSLRVVPFSAGLHHGIMSGPFVMLRFPLNGNGQDTEPPTVYVESFTGALYLDRPHEVARYDTAFTNIWESSLDERASRELITQVARELAK